MAIAAWNTHVRTAAMAMDGALASVLTGRGATIGAQLDEASRALGLARSDAATDILANDGTRAILRSAAGSVDEGRLLLRADSATPGALESTLRSAQFAVDLLLPG